MTEFGELRWTVVRVAGEDTVGGDLSVEAGELRFRPGKGYRSLPAAWSFTSALPEIAAVETVERTLRHMPWSLERGIRVRTVRGAQATFYLGGRAKNRADVVVAGLLELVRSSRVTSEGKTSAPTAFVDEAERAPVGGSTRFFRNLQRWSWLFGLMTIAVFSPELVAGLREPGDGFGRAWVLVYPGNFIAIGIFMVLGGLGSGRKHPLLATLPISLYLVGTSILALVIYAFYVMPASAALAPLLFGIPAAIATALTLSPTRRRSWREAQDNDRAAAIQPPSPGLDIA